MPTLRTASATILLLSAALILAQTESWRVLPIRSQEEFELGAFGGEGEQHPHSITRCLSDPDVLYLSQDVAGAWRSGDGGVTWNKCLDKGLHVNAGQSIAVDPDDPAVVFIVVDNAWNWLAPEYEGLYRSQDSGENWVLVLQTGVNYSSSLHRMYQHNVDFDPVSRGSSGPAQRWYAAFHDNGIYRSDDGGVTWPSAAVGSLSGYQSVFVVRAHPTDGRTVFVGTEQGLLVSDSLGTDPHALGDLPVGDVTSVEVDPDQPSRIWATIRGTGLYRSENAGTTFVQVRSLDVQRVFMNPGFPNTLYLVGTNRNSLVTHDGGQSWDALDSVTTFPGLGRETGWRRYIHGNMCGVAPSAMDSLDAVAYANSTIFKTVDGGVSFAESATGWTGNAWSWWNGAVAFDRLDSNRIAFFCNDVGMKITLNGGDWFEPATNNQAWNWYQANEISWMGTYAGDFRPVAGSEVIVQAIGNYWDTRLCRTSNNGGLWELVPTAEASDINLFVSFHPDDPDVVYAGDKMSADAGVTFAPIDFGSFDNPTLVGMCRAVPDVAYAMDDGRYAILRSRDRGATWEEFTRPGWRFRKVDGLPTFAADPVDSLKVYSIDNAGDLAVFDGNAWTSLHVLDEVGGPDFNFVRTVTVDPNDADVVYAGLFASGGACLMRSLDAGSTWADLSLNRPRNGLGAMAVNPHNGELYTGSCIGTWILPAPGGQGSIGHTPNSSPVRTARLTIARGPQGHAIVYDVPDAHEARLYVTDTRGRTVAREEGVRSRGSVLLASLAAGTYTCILEGAWGRVSTRLVVGR